MMTTVATPHVLNNGFLNPSMENTLSSSNYNTMDEYELYEKGFPLRNKYKFIKLLQTGSFGKVTLAIDDTTSVKYAIKSMYKKQGAMFRHEINIMKKLGSHPNLVELVEHFDTTKFHVLVLEYCDDGDLYDKIEEMRMLSETPIFALHLIRQLITAIRYMHSKNIYHRDFKPENILLMKNGDLKLCDFGLSTILQYPNEVNVGTEKYMSPESINETNYDAKRADYWSLGITLCFLLFGKCPFRKASLDDDHFINYINNQQWLLTYYNNMSFRTFKLMSNLLSLSPKDRDLDQFEVEFIEAVQLGLTINQELEYSNTSNLDDYMFEMDGDNNNNNNNNRTPQLSMNITDIGPDDEMFEFDGKDLPLMPPLISIPPSLIESHMNSFSWADDDDEFELRFNQQQHLQYINESAFNNVAK